MKIGRRRISKKVLFIAVALVVIVFAGTGAAFAAGAVQFSDIAGNTHEASILKEAARGVAGGYPDGTFRPNDPVTRGQMMTFLDRFNSGITCTECHNSGTELTGKVYQWDRSLHGDLVNNVFMDEGTRNSCAGCHTGNGFADMIAAGQNPSQVTVGQANPTPQDCRACHQIHTSFTDADWALRTTAPVALYAVPGKTFDGGAGNLCATCHEPRTAFPAPDANGNVAVSSHFGPHHGPQAAIFLGVDGAGSTQGSQSPHLIVPDTCVTCHMGPITDQDANGVDQRPDAGHTFLPDVNTCKTCHPTATNFDIDGVQTKVTGLLGQLKTALIAKGALKADGSIVAGTYSKAVAQAVWNYAMCSDDRSLGVHNPAYIQALLTDSINLVK